MRPLGSRALSTIPGVNGGIISRFAANIANPFESCVLFFKG